jgi:hypothetical protein
MKTMEQSTREWAKEQTTETLKTWTSNMKKTNQEKANMSKMAKEMTMAACEEMKNR